MESNLIEMISSTEDVHLSLWIKKLVRMMSTFGKPESTENVHFIVRKASTFQYGMCPL